VVRKMKHKACGEELDSVSVWASSQIDQYVFEDGKWRQSFFREDPTEVVVTYYCNRCGKPLSEEEAKKLEDKVRF